MQWAPKLKNGQEHRAINQKEDGVGKQVGGLAQGALGPRFFEVPVMYLRVGLGAVCPASCGNVDPDDMTHDVRSHVM